MGDFSLARLWQRPQLLLITLTALFGLQILRVFFPLLVFVLGDRFGWPPPQVAQVVLVIFLFTAGAGALARLTGSAMLITSATFVVGFSRLAMQLWTGDPVGDLLIVLPGLIAFLLFVPGALAIARTEGSARLSSVGLCLLAAGALDVAVNGWYLTYDLAWRTGWQDHLFLALLVLVQMVLLVRVVGLQVSFAATDPARGEALRWAAYGFYLFLQALVFGNIAFLNAHTGWPVTANYALLLGGQVAGLLLALRAGRRLTLAGLALVALLALSQLAAPFAGGNLPPIGHAARALLGQIGLALVLMTVVRGLDSPTKREGFFRLLSAHAGALLLMVLLVFGYYAQYDSSLPFDNALLPLMALVLFLAAGMAAFRTTRGERETTGVGDRTFSLLLPLLLLLPLFLWWRLPSLETELRQREGHRVMTYNIHNGFNPAGRMALEAQARLIAAQSPDVVALQEISRGWIINGAVDDLVWLSRRLELPYVWGPTDDAQWGNAVLSRYPILEQEIGLLAPADLPLQRGYTRVIVATDQGPLQIINTHLYHRPDGGEARVEQTAALLDVWDGQPRTVVLGDLNAEPETPEVVALLDAGLVDAVAAAGVDPGFTSPAAAPVRRLDYVLLSPDLAITAAAIPPVAASDHLPVVVTIR